MLFTLISCSDDSDKDNNITQPEEEYVGATFQFRDGQVWKYNLFSIDFRGYTKFDSEIYYLAKYNGIDNKKESYKYHNSIHPSYIDTGPYMVMSTTDDGLYVKFEDDKVFQNIFPEVVGEWHKVVDYKNDRWTQYDLEVIEEINDTLWVVEYYNFYGKKVSDKEIEYKGETHKSTKYVWYYEAIIDSRKPNSFYRSGKVFVTILDGIGIYEWDEKEGIRHKRRTLVEHKDMQQ